MKELGTWANRRSFSYKGSTKEGTEITFGRKGKQFVSSEQWSELLKHFSGRTVSIGTSRTAPPKDSVGEWLMENVTRIGIASYVGPILIFEGHAEKGERADIKFRRVD